MCEACQSFFASHTFTLLFDSQSGSNEIVKSWDFHQKSMNTQLFFYKLTILDVQYSMLLLLTSQQAFSQYSKLSQKVEIK